MTQAEIRDFRKSLLTWYRRRARALPWRQTGDPYPIWVSEVMLQQTQVNTVIPYFLRFLDRMPTVQDLAKADPDAVLKLWEGLGYYARVRNLHKAAGIVVKDHGGRIPSDPAAFRKLPGVGEYIAAAVMSIAFGQALPVVDGNVKRVLARLFCIGAPVNAAANHSVFREYAARLLAEKDPGTFNQAMMELGALICRPQQPLCGDCPVRRRCVSFRHGTVEVYPKRQAKVAVPTHLITAAVIHRNGRMLVVQRPVDGLLGGLWEFPGGKIEAGESSQAACKRNIRRITGLMMDEAVFLTRVKHAYTHFKIEMDVFQCRRVSGRVRLNGPVAHRWIKVEDMAMLTFHKAMHKVIPHL